MALSPKCKSICQPKNMEHHGTQGLKTNNKKGLLGSTRCNVESHQHPWPALIPRRLPAVLDREFVQVCFIDASSVAAVKGRTLKRQPRMSRNTNLCVAVTYGDHFQKPSWRNQSGLVDHWSLTYVFSLFRIQPLQSSWKIRWDGKIPQDWWEIGGP